MPKSRNQADVIQWPTAMLRLRTDASTRWPFLWARSFPLSRWLLLAWCAARARSTNLETRHARSQRPYSTAPSATASSRLQPGQADVAVSAGRDTRTAQGVSNPLHDSRTHHVIAVPDQAVAPVGLPAAPVPPAVDRDSGSFIGLERYRGEQAPSGATAGSAPLAERVRRGLLGLSRRQHTPNPARNRRPTEAKAELRRLQRILTHGRRRLPKRFCLRCFAAARTRSRVRSSRR